MGKNYYAVKMGTEPGIYESWQECESVIKGFSGAKYKSFKTREDAEMYLKETDNDETEQIVHTYKEEPDNVEHVIAYVDGSYDHRLKRYGYGVVLITSQFGIHTESGYGEDAEYIESRNVSGEILGALTAMRLAVQGGFKCLTLYYDYQGIKEWAVGGWKAKSSVAQEYVMKTQSYKSVIDIEFVHAEAHKGIRFNEDADRLAREAIHAGTDLVKGIVTNGDTWITVSGVSESDLTAIIEILSEDDKIKVMPKNVNNGVTQYSLRKNREKLVVKHFKASSKICAQGIRGDLYHSFVSYLGIVVSPEEITEVLNRFYDVDIPLDKIEQAYEYYLPCVSGLPDAINTLTRQAVYNLLIKGNMPDYGHLFTPASRALEYHLKSILKSCGVHADFGFDCYEYTMPGGKRYQLNTNTRSIINNAFVIQHLNDGYNLFVAHRHTLSHCGIDVGNANDTRLVSTIEEVKDLIIKTLGLINDYYAHI